jgi:hypothetical protein
VSLLLSGVVALPERRHSGKVEGVVLIAVDLPRSWLRRSRLMPYLPADASPTQKSHLPFRPVFLLEAGIRWRIVRVAPPRLIASPKRGSEKRLEKACREGLRKGVVHVAGA